ncbi:MULTISPECIES: hypothetical protein [unclassified Ensifer]|uniref:hypothetical protein n=1 Tax=unclassified Ensifer TaxID=2633371 RepID=UPI00070CEEB2|nr:MULTISPECIES: hypothetical protein [unclassified Ensifer]KQW43171.1 hypothetical protein ASD02_35410 [Ensifer sp. Root1252]KRC67109.1 hypothetical protein ASE32_35640 [Ensifer sp. Root231]KRC93688.1 hypothetical protein ASE47_35495 [Ensifer sp. Root258]
MNSKVTLLLPTPPGPSVSTTIRNSKFAIIQRTALGPLPTALALDPGYYMALVEFPDGRRFETAFQVRDGDLTTEVELEELPTRTVRSKRGGRPNQGQLDFDAEFSEIGADVSPDDPLPEPTGGDFSIALVTIDSSGSVTETQPLAQTLPGTIKIEQGSASRFVRITRGREPRNLYIAIPTSAEEGAEIIFSSLAPLAYEVKLEDDRADFLLDCIENGRVEQLSDVVADCWPKLEALADIGSENLEEFSSLVSKHWTKIDGVIGRALSSDLGSWLLGWLPAIEKPLGWAGRTGEWLKLSAEYQPQIAALLKARRIKPVMATVAGYALLLVGPPTGDDEKIQGDTVDLLAKLLFGTSPWLADQLCIRGELLARQAEHEKALSVFLEVSRLGSPMFSMGLRYTLDRLKSYRNSALAGKLDPECLGQIEAALDRLQRIAAWTDFSRPLVTFEPLVGTDLAAESARDQRPIGAY